MEHRSTDRRLVLSWGLCAAAVVVALMVLTWYFVPRWYKRPETAAALGDMFGVVNALFSGLALAGVIIAISLQSKELGLQREELEATREELRGQKEQLTLQQETMARQRFENTFFHHMELLNSIIASMDIGGGKDRAPATGRDCFLTLLGYVWSMSRPKRAAGMKDSAAIMAGYEEFYRKYNTEIGHYFRTLYSTVRYVHETPIEDKMVYMRLVRAQLSSGELALLALNCLTPQGQKFKPLVEHYALLKHLPVPMKGLNEEQTREITAHYDTRAFGGRAI